MHSIAVHSTNDKAEPLFDTTGLNQAPIKITSAKISSKLIDTVDQPADNLHHEGHFGRYITVKIKYKNTSSKRIVGARLNWLIVDKNDKPTTVGDVKNGLQMGYMGTLSPTNLTGFNLGIGETKTDEWEYKSNAGEKIKIAFSSGVQFYDNKKWKIGKEHLITKQLLLKLDFDLAAKS
ncbi:hypothetical protein HH214_12585 [Mucilaginibacter robiniae]|uniref:Uncharacterized protein n=1 Tax=Mucilaginibacter robiniae TaxID=2728022 RepID=A0A7L5E4K9_9SPHI|nr:hypothetical protein [Mucilaginibacter robiniae]QJD96654.1 hypothetical protein HH214_12585 [Mucilaginibacter robiniae]